MSGARLELGNARALAQGVEQRSAAGNTRMSCDVRRCDKTACIGTHVRSHGHADAHADAHTDAHADAHG